MDIHVILGYKTSFFYIDINHSNDMTKFNDVTRMNKTVCVAIDLTLDFNFFPQKLDPRINRSLTFNNSFTLNFSVYTRSYTVYMYIYIYTYNIY